MQILITGGAGFIGSHTADRLLSLGYRVRILDSLEKPVHQAGKPKYLSKKAEFIKGDVRDRAAVGRALRGVDAVFHFAAYQDNLPDYSRYFDVNATGTALLYEVIWEKKLPIKKVIVASSQAVMGEGAYRCTRHGVVYPSMRSLEHLRRGEWEVACPEGGEPVKMLKSDEHVTNPQSQYAMSKYAQEMIAVNLGKQLGISTVALRYSIVQGPRQSFYNPYSGACRQFCLSLHFGVSPEIYEDGRQIRDYVNIEDVVDANILVLKDKRADGEVFNVGGGKGYLVLEFYEIVRRVFGSDLAPKVSGAFRAGDVRHILSDISKLKKLGWRPKHSPGKSVRDYRDWLLTQKNLSKKILVRHKKLRKAVVM